MDCPRASSALGFSGLCIDQCPANCRQFTTIIISVFHRLNTEAEAAEKIVPREPGRGVNLL